MRLFHFSYLAHSFILTLSAPIFYVIVLMLQRKIIIKKIYRNWSKLYEECGCMNVQQWLVGWLAGYMVSCDSIRVMWYYICVVRVLFVIYLFLCWWLLWLFTTIVIVVTVTITGIIIAIIVTIDTTAITTTD